MKKIIFIIIIILISLILSLFLITTLGNAKKIMVIGYHKFVSNDVKNEYFKNDIWIDSLDNLEFQLKVFKLLGYSTLSLEEYNCWHNNTCEQPKKSVLLTFDDGDKGVYHDVLPLLKKYNAKAVVFIIGENTNSINHKYNSAQKQFLSKSEIDLIKKEYSNLEIQSHSFGMHKNGQDGKKIIHSMSNDEIKQDFEKMKEYNTKYFCYPGGAHTQELLTLLDINNYKMAFKYDKSSLSTKNDKKYLIPRVSINGSTSKMGFMKWIIKDIINNI